MMKVLCVLFLMDTLLALRFTFPAPAQDVKSESSHSLLSTKSINSIDLMTRLWDGEDVLLEEEEEFLASSEFANISRVIKENGSKIQVLGGFDSGTNLLVKLLQTNLGTIAFQNLCQQWEGHCLIWKHTAPWNVEKELKRRGHNLKDVVMVVLVRSPLAHISGWLKAPYDFGKCLGKDRIINHELQSKDCSLNPKEQQATNMGTLEQAWNAYMNGYSQLKSQGANMIMVEYENLVLDTENTMRRVFKALGADVKHVTQYGSAAKTHGNPVGHAEAVQKISHSLYMSKAPFNDVILTRGTCSKLDTDMMKGHSFPVLAQNGQTQSRDYSKDCSDLMVSQ